MRRRIWLVAVLVSACAGSHVEVAPTGGAGFAGVRSYELLQESAFTIPATCNAQRCAPIQVLDSVDLVPNHHYSWHPALSTGVSFQRYSNTGTKLGGGVGVNMVILSDGNGSISPWPAATLHLGTHSAGFFFGLIVSPTDGIQLPGGASTIRVQRDHIPTLILKNTGRAGHLYMGIQIGGKGITLGDTT